MTRSEIADQIVAIQQFAHNPQNSRLVLAGVISGMLLAGGSIAIYQHLWEGQHSWPKASLAVVLILMLGPMIACITVVERRKRRHLEMHPAPVCPHCALPFSKYSSSTRLRAIGSCPRCKKSAVSDPRFQNDPMLANEETLLDHDDFCARVESYVREGRRWR
ncbi:hypothetical protein [Verrucomicrobium sp. BvORR106]|uniref:hypothetical protein n=1 Tax=Verrucomicrobium sp. BvORR106 TaxID=1403819 RepID=UPI000571720A|nr:hypothetical protein [Verrucomicrobium sp. BvORR106]